MPGRSSVRVPPLAHLPATGPSCARRRPQKGLGHNPGPDRRLRRGNRLRLDPGRGRAARTRDGYQFCRRRPARSRPIGRRERRQPCATSHPARAQLPVHESGHGLRRVIADWFRRRLPSPRGARSDRHSQNQAVCSRMPRSTRCSERGDRSSDTHRDQRKRPRVVSCDHDADAQLLPTPGRTRRRGSRARH